MVKKVTFADENHGKNQKNVEFDNDNFTKEGNFKILIDILLYNNPEVFAFICQKLSEEHDTSNSSIREMTANDVTRANSEIRQYAYDFFGKERVCDENQESKMMALKEEFFLQMEVQERVSSPNSVSIPFSPDTKSAASEPGLYSRGSRFGL